MNCRYQTQKPIPLSLQQLYYLHTYTIQITITEQIYSSKQESNVLKSKCGQFYQSLQHFYRPGSEGDNVLGSVRPSVSQSTLSRLNRLTYDLDIWYVG